MKFHCAALFILLTTSLLAQPLSLFNGYNILEYSYHQITFDGNDIFHFWRYNELAKGLYTSDMRILTSMNSKYELQTRQHNIIISSGLSYAYELHKSRYLISGIDENSPNNIYGEEKRESSVLGVTINGGLSGYFNDPFGLFAFADPYLGYEQTTDGKGYQASASLATGIGYGRVRGEMNIAQAHALLTELGITADEKRVYAVADILEKSSAGYYQAKYRDSSYIVLYDDIAKITGKSSEAPKVAQVLSSTYYKISPRYNGWHVKLGLLNNYFKVDKDPTLYAMNGRSIYAGDASLEAKYAVPFGGSMQFIAAGTLVKNLQNEDSRGLLVQLETDFSIDHNYFWSTSFSARVSRAKPLKGDKRVNQQCRLQTNYMLFSRLSASFLLEYTNEEFYTWRYPGHGYWYVPCKHSELIDVRMNIKYYIL